MIHRTHWSYLHFELSPLLNLMTIDGAVYGGRSLASLLHITMILIGWQV